jgi:hypothetical protein
LRSAAAAAAAAVAVRDLPLPDEAPVGVKVDVAADDIPSSVGAGAAISAIHANSFLIFSSVA